MDSHLASEPLLPAASHVCVPVEPAAASACGRLSQRRLGLRRHDKSKRSWQWRFTLTVMAATAAAAASMAGLSVLLRAPSVVALLSSSQSSSSASVAMPGNSSSSSAAVEAWPRAPLRVENGTVEACEEIYGALPCSSSVSGNLFLMLAYGYIVLLAAKFISDGSELLLQVLNPGIIGGLVLPILGALPDTLLIATSGSKGTREEAQEQVLVGMGVLAGSTVMILTVAWGGSLLCGRCDLVENETGEKVAKDKTLTKPFDLAETGVTTDEQTRLGAWIMIASVVPYLIMQIPVFYGHPEKDILAAFVGLVLALGGLIGYCAYQVLSPWLQSSRIANARMLYIHSLVLRDMHHFALHNTFGALLDSNGEADVETLSRIFQHFDTDHSASLSKEELKALIVGLKVPQLTDLPEEEEISQWMTEFDTNSDGNIGQEEFIKGMQSWLKHLQSSNSYSKNYLSSLSTPAAASSAIKTLALDDHAAKAKSQFESLQQDVAEEDEDEEEEEGLEHVRTPAEIYRDAILLIVGGAVLVAIFADPVVDSISAFSEASHIPPFFVAFVVSPLVSNASELVSSLVFSLRKRKRCISLTYSQVYGAITMNNTMCLGTFLALVFFRQLIWEFSAEVTIILAITLIVGVVGGTRRTFPTWFAFPILSLYPISVATVAFLDYVLGWT